MQDVNPLHPGSDNYAGDLKVAYDAGFAEALRQMGRTCWIKGCGGHPSVGGISLTGDQMKGPFVSMCFCHHEEHKRAEKELRAVK